MYFTTANPEGSTIAVYTRYHGAVYDPSIDAFLIIYNNTLIRTTIVSWSHATRILYNEVAYNPGDSIFIQNNY